MKNHAPLRRGVLLVICLTLVLLPIALSAILWNDIYTNSFLSELVVEQSRWNARDFSDYRMTLTRERINRRCQQRIEVRDDQISAILADNCHTQPLTINSVFDLLRVNLTPDQCSDDVCRCKSGLRMSASYDVELGYPSLVLIVNSQIRVEHADAENWGQAPGDNRLIVCGAMSGPMYETLAITDVVRLTQAQR